MVARLEKQIGMALRDGHVPVDAATEKALEKYKGKTTYLIQQYWAKNPMAHRALRAPRVKKYAVYRCFPSTGQKEMLDRHFYFKDEAVEFVQAAMVGRVSVGMGRGRGRTTMGLSASGLLLPTRELADTTESTAVMWENLPDGSQILSRLA